MDSRMMETIKTIKWKWNIKTTDTEMKNILYRFSSRLDGAKKRISEFWDQTKKKNQEREEIKEHPGVVHIKHYNIRKSRSSE